MVGGDESLWHAANSPQVGPTGVCLAAPMLRSLWCLAAHSVRRRSRHSWCSPVFARLLGRSDARTCARPFLRSDVLPLIVSSAAPVLCSRWNLAAHSSQPTWLRPLGSAHSAQPTRLSPLGSAHSAQPTRSAPLVLRRVLRSAALSYARPLRSSKRSGARSGPVWHAVVLELGSRHLALGHFAARALTSSVASLWSCDHWPL